MNSELSYSSPTAGLISQCVVKFVELAADDIGAYPLIMSALFRQLQPALLACIQSRPVFRILCALSVEHSSAISQQVDVYY